MARIIVLSTGERYRMKMTLTSIARLSRFTESEWRSYQAHMTVDKTDPDPAELANRPSQQQEA